MDGINPPVQKNDARRPGLRQRTDVLGAQAFGVEGQNSILDGAVCDRRKRHFRDRRTGRRSGLADGLSRCRATGQSERNGNDPDRERANYFFHRNERTESAIEAAILAMSAAVNAERRYEKPSARALLD